MAKSIKRFKLGELFCGPGGIACGALRSRSSDGKLSIEHAWANDYDYDTCLTYIMNICPDRPETVLPQKAGGAAGAAGAGAGRDAPQSRISRGNQGAWRAGPDAG